MKSIDEYKKEILLKIMSEEELSWDYIQTLPKDDSLRIFICELGPTYAYWYSYLVDKCPHEDTRKAAYRDPKYAYWYANDVDRGPHEDTREAAYKDPYWRQAYIETFGE